MNARRRRARMQAAMHDIAAPEINTTPLIDVMLVLLIMLIVTIPVRLDAVDMTTPPAPAQAPPKPPIVVDLQIGPGRLVQWNHEAVNSQQRLRELLHAAAQAEPPQELHLHPDPRASYDTFARVLATAEREGVTRMGIVETARSETAQP